MKTRKMSNLDEVVLVKIMIHYVLLNQLKMLDAENQNMKCILGNFNNNNKKNNNNTGPA